MHVGDCDCKKKMRRMSDVGRPRGEGEPRKMRAMRAMGAS